jgi:predicted anti-sigma-YlaC factor YlaD
MACQEGQDGTALAYRERLAAPWWLWLVAAVFVISVAVAYGFALGTTAGVLAALATGAAVTALLLATTVTISVDECVLRAGRARLPVQFAGAIEVLDKPAATHARTAGFDPSAFVLLRTWSTNRAVRVTVTDARDPHSAWLLSSKDPAALAAALGTSAASAIASDRVGSGTLTVEELP